MCQGVIVSLVKFQNDKGKNKRAVLKGIGSHSSLIKNNQKLLKKLGWTENAKNQEVVSIESDFSGWNKFTVESGNPSKVDLAILSRAYKECASNARVLISHVKRIGKTDDALVSLLIASAKKVYCDTIASAEKVYYDKTTRVWTKLFRTSKNRIECLR